MIAKADMIVITPAGDKSKMKIGIQSIYENDHGDYCCDLKLPDQEKPTTLFGIDSFQALTISMNYMGSRLKDLQESGWSFYYEGCDEKVDWGIYFMFPDYKQKLEDIAYGNDPTIKEKQQD